MDTNSRYDARERFEHAPNPATTDAYAAQPIRGRAVQVAAPVATVEFGSGWYHAAAIETAKGDHAHPYR